MFRKLPTKSAIFVLLIGIIILLIISFSQKKQNEAFNFDKPLLWSVQSVDSVKYSRDVAREKANDPTYDKVIEDHVSAIAGTGATHIAIGTPYNQEFVPFMKRWVSTARKYNLKVWFRGNVAGWEQWFGYPKITRVEHTKQTQEFILANGDLFEDGDIFSSCPECENGGPGDPRINGDVAGHRKFLIDEYKVVRESFQNIDRKVTTSFNPMNGDVARLIMNKETTQALGGFVVVDHYVKTPEKTVADAKEFARLSGGKVILGEFGAPIPDIHGNMTESEQADWLDKTLSLLSKVPEVVGVNYWTSHGGSTQLWNYDNTPKEGVELLTKYFKPRVFSGIVVDEINKPIKGAQVKSSTRIILTDDSGSFSIPVFENESILVTADGFESLTLNSDDKISKIVLDKTHEPISYKIYKILQKVQIVFK